MKATELMIGDYVRYIGTETFGDMRQGDIVKVDAMQGKYICVGDGWAYGDMFEPIPLTEEILEQNGFVRHDKHEYSVTGSNYNYLKVICYADTYFEIGNAFDEEGELQAFADIQYVHELQHALRLCRIDKNIEL